MPFLHLTLLYLGELLQYNIYNLETYMIKFVDHKIAIIGKREYVEKNP